MKFIVVEGLDGAGKSTQIKYLRKYFDTQGISHFYLHFPRTDAPVFGELIARFLRGEFGNIEEVHPYLVALIYAGDRKDAAETILSHINKGHYVIVDRYVYSNIAYQGAKFHNKSEQNKLKDWILQLEYEYYRIPRPDINLFLDVPFQFTEAKLSKERKGADREYLNGNHDIHEQDLNFQQFVRKIYVNQASEDDSLKIIDCSDGGNSMLQPEKIFKKIIEVLKQERILV